MSIVRTCLPNSLLSSRICFGHLRPYFLISISLHLFVVIFAFYTHTTQLITGIIYTHSHRASSQTVKTTSLESKLVILHAPCGPPRAIHTLGLVLLSGSNPIHTRNIQDEVHNIQISPSRHRRNMIYTCLIQDIFFTDPYPPDLARNPPPNHSTHTRPLYPP